MRWEALQRNGRTQSCSCDQEASQVCSTQTTVLLLCVPWCWCEDEAFPSPCPAHSLWRASWSLLEPLKVLASSIQWLARHPGLAFQELNSWDSRYLLSVLEPDFVIMTRFLFTLAGSFSSSCPLHIHPLPLPLAQGPHGGPLAHGQGQELFYLRKPKASRGAFGPFLPSLGGLGDGVSTVPP